jgi:excisionase family DNA binding protein
MRSSPKIEPAYFDLAGAAAYLGGALAVRTLRRLIAQPDGLPYYRISGGKIMIRKMDLDAYLSQHRKSPADLDAMATKAIQEFRK